MKSMKINLTKRQEFKIKLAIAKHKVKFLLSQSDSPILKRKLTSKIAKAIDVHLAKAKQSKRIAGSPAGTKVSRAKIDSKRGKKTKK